MYWDVTAVKPIEYLTLKVTFIDGLEGTVASLNPSKINAISIKCISVMVLLPGQENLI